MKKNKPLNNISGQSEHSGSNITLSLVIPCYNEAARINIMLEGLAEFNEKWKGDYEVIIVDDGSKDQTSEKIQEALNTKYSFLKDKIQIERIPVNRGKGNALKKGVSLATGDYVLTLDADMSTRPVELIYWQQREKGLFSGADVIYIGSRKHDEGKVEALLHRKVIGTVFTSIVQVLTTLNLNDTQCGFKLYPKHIAGLLFGNMQSKGWSHDVELLYQADLNGIKIVEMPITWTNQPESKVNVFSDSVKMFFGVLSISLRTWFYNSFILPFKMPATLTSAQRKNIIYRSVFNILATLLVIVMPVLSFQFAINGDEHCHFDYGNSIYNYFFGHPDSYALTGIPEGAPPGTSTSGLQYYGGLFDFITGTAYNAFHIWDHYSTMHFINALVGAIGIIYAGKLAKLLGGWPAAILTVIFLVLSPSWFGHNFDNPKDIPFSAGYTAGIYFILLFLKAFPRPNAKHIFGLVCSIGWAMGVRIGGLLLIAYFAFFVGVFALFTNQLKAVFTARTIKQVLLVSVLGYLIAVTFWPYAHEGIISKPLESLKIMTNFFVNIGLLYDGKKILSNEVPWYYIPRYILYTAPIIVLAGFVIGLIALPVAFRNNKKLLICSLLVLFAVVFPPAYAIYKKSSLYDGWRHFLFIYPPLVILASLGWTYLMSFRQKAVRYATIGLIVIGLVSPIQFVAAYHPLESLYYNEICGGLKNIYGRFETDYYMLGIRPATEWLIKNEHLENKKVTVATNCINPVQAYLKPYDLDRQAVYVRYYERYSKDWDYCILYSRFVDVSQLNTGNWPPPETIYTLKVQGVPIAAVLKRKTHKDFLGFQLLKEKKIPEAKEQFLQSLQEYPNNDLVWEALTQIYNAEGKADSAIYAGRQTLKSYPGDITVYEILGNIYLKQNRADSAINLYKNLVQYNAGYGHFFLGYTYATMGNATMAFNEIDNAIEADPTNQQAYKLGIQLAQQTKNSSKAEEYYDKAKKAFPEKEGE
jgi:glycosyltransferase involved in cell wall biosynthesis/tetratricopeptide (TPR) repeat protein